MSKANIDAIYRLAPVQEGILYHNLQAPGSDVYLEQFSCTLDELEDSDRWREAWQACARRHPALRTLFTWEKRDHPLQIVRRAVELPWQEEDWRHLSAEEQAREFESLRRRDRGRAFDLSKAPLLRFELLRTGHSSYYFLWTFHHILLDGWSQRLLLSEALAHYNHRGGQAVEPAPTYESFVSWLQRRDTSGDAEFWTRQLASCTQPCLLAERHPVSPSKLTDSTASVEILELDPALSEQLGRAAARHQVTLNTLVVAAWSLLLAAHCRRQDVVFGTTVSGRPAELAQVGEIAGMCINTVPLRLGIPTGGKLTDFLKTVQATQLASRQFENTSLATIQKCSGVAPGAALFDNIVVFENLPESAVAAVSPKVIEPRFDEFSHYPLAILVEPGTALKLSAVHRQAQFSADDAASLLRQLQCLLRQLAQLPAPQLEELSLLAPGERYRIEVEWNACPQPAEPAAAIHRLFEDRARQQPQALALVGGQGSLSFAQLNAAANRLASYLVQRGLRPDGKVVVFMPRSPEAIVSFLAVLKAGGVYIPLDADTPVARVAAILQDLREHSPLILSQGPLSGQLPAEHLSVINADLEQDSIAACPDQDLELEIAPDMLAYIIYTSGSTGKPKGVMVEHRALVNSTLARLDYYPEQPGRFLLMSSLAVDSSVAGIYWCLCRGATLVLPEHRLEQNLDGLGQLIEREQVSHLLCIPSLYQLLLDHGQGEHLQSLACVIVAGEACLPGLIERHRALMGSVKLYNEYGPSECTVWATVADLSRWSPGQLVPIGRPIPGAVAYILDARGHSVPPGVPGELYLGGAALARGYLDDPERTLQAFQQLNSVELPQGLRDLRLYRTGDRARYRSDGQIEFLGRVDNQLKVRGHRVEPEEVEQALCRLPEVREAAVFLSRAGMAGQSGGSAVQLVACLIASDTASVTVAALREYAAQQLPAYMVPQRFRLVQDLPRETGGKIARRLLADFDWVDLPGTTSVPGRQTVAAPAVTEQQQTLLAIWREVLDVEEIGVDSNFFELGGDSLLSIRVLSRARKAGLEIAADEFFDNPTVAAQASLATRGGQAPDSDPLPMEELTLSPVQGWFFRHIDSHPQQWNQSLLLRVTTALDVDVLDRALEELVRRHEALRLRFEQTADGWRPTLANPVSAPTLHRVRVSGRGEEQVAAAAEREAGAMSRDFDLSRGPLLASCYLQTDPGLDDRLLLCAHHLLVDVESWRILVQELSALWRAFAAGQQAPSPEQGDSYRRWITGLVSYARSAELLAQAAHWESVVTARGANLPLDRPGRELENLNVTQQQVRVSLSREHTSVLLQELPRKFNCGLQDALLTGLLISLHEWTGAERLHIDVEGHGREQLLPGMDASRTVGWLTSVHPQLLNVISGEDVIETLLRIKDRLRAAPHRGVGFGVLRYLTAAGESGPLAGRGPAQVCFNYLGRLDRPVADTGPLQVERENLGELRAPDGPRAYILEVNCWLRDGVVELDLGYSSALHERDTIARLADNYLAALGQLVAACANVDDTVYSSSDFPMANLDRDDLARIGQLLGDDGA